MARASTTSVLQRGTGQRTLVTEDRFRFDITGYLQLGQLVDPDTTGRLREQVEAGCSAGVPVAGVELLPNGNHAELRNVVELGGPFLEVLGYEPIPSYTHELVWGEQVRMIGSRALRRVAGVGAPLTQGGNTDPRRFRRFRAFVEGEFRCLLVSVLIALDDTQPGDGTFGVVPASHKAHFTHPYADTPAEEVAVVRQLALPAGHAVMFSDNASYALTSVAASAKHWLLYQYGPSYLLDWPGCSPSAATRATVQHDATRAALLREPYYH